MKRIFRVPIVLIVVLAVYFFIYWVPFSLTSLHDTAIPSIVSLLCASGAGWSVWKGLGSGAGGLVSHTLRGAAVLGGIGFCGGFFGPMIFAPGANQGPLLGLFITGPSGFFLGGAGGFVYGLVKRNRTVAE